MNRVTGSAAFTPTSFPGRSVTDHVADALRVAIGNGTFRPGEALNQAQLAEQFRVSHIPVREAIRRLEAEGLVRVIPNRGAFVAELSAEEVEELYDIRIPLELRALRLAIPRLGKADFREAARLLSNIDELRLQDTDIARWGELDRAFHLLLYRASGRPRLVTIIEQLRANTGRYSRAFLQMADQRAVMQSEHHALLQSCERGDTDAATDILERHLLHSCAMVSGSVRQLSASSLVR